MFFLVRNSDVNGELAAVTTDGTCGRDHGNTRCGDWPQGGVRAFSYSYIGYG